MGLDERFVIADLLVQAREQVIGGVVARVDLDDLLVGGRGAREVREPLLVRRGDALVQRDALAVAAAIRSCDSSTARYLSYCDVFSYSASSARSATRFSGSTSSTFWYATIAMPVSPRCSSRIEPARAADRRDRCRRSRASRGATGCRRAAPTPRSRDRWRSSAASASADAGSCSSTC